MAELPGMGWLPDVPDIRDYTENAPEVANLLARTKLAPRIANVQPATVSSAAQSGGAAVAAAAAPVLTVPPTVDLRAWCSPIEDQGQLGSCTANAAVGLVEYFERRAFGKFIDGSRLFVYKTTRDLMNVTGDTGAYLRTTMGALVLFGVPPESYCPYNIAKYDVEPSTFLYALAQNFQSVTYFRLDPPGMPLAQVLNNIKTYLAGGFPSMFGFPVYDEFMNIAQNGLVPLPKKGSKLYGGHAICAVGYDDNLQFSDGSKGGLLIRNSWGKTWGLQGYAWLSYKYVTNGLAQDWWSLVKGEWVDTGQFS